MIGEKILQTLQKSWKALLESHPNSIAHEPGLAKLGDVYVNFVYSLAKSVVLDKATGYKVPDAVLANAFRKSQLSKTSYTQIRGSKGKVGDSIEALLLWGWLTEKLQLDELVEILSSNLDPNSFIHSRSEAESATKAFAAALDTLTQRLEGVKQNIDQ